MKPIRLGQSVEGRGIIAYVLGEAKGRPLLVLGGFHGDEPKSVSVTRHLVDYVARQMELLKHSEMTGFCEKTSRLESARAKARGSILGPLSDIRLIVVPLVNPDGYERRRRRNSHRVDINRNFPTEDWVVGIPRSRMFGGFKPASEPETRAVIRAVEWYHPAVIISVHSISGHRFCNNYDGPSRCIARRMSKRNGYGVRASMGYATPGSFGTWAGLERGIPTITLELPSHHSSKQCWLDNRRALLECLPRTSPALSV